MAPEETYSYDSSFTFKPVQTKRAQETTQGTTFSRSMTICPADTGAANKVKSVQDTTVCKSDNPFLYYSNDDIRLKKLKLEEVPDTVSVKNQTRKTRLTFEMDPFAVIMGDLLDKDDLESILTYND